MVDTLEVDEVAPVSEQSLEQTLDFVTWKIRNMVPGYQCEHNDPFCLSCGLKHLVEDSVLFEGND